MNKLFNFIAAIALSAFTITTAFASAEPSPSVSESQLAIVSAVARPSMDGSSNSAAYITFHNNGTSDITIIGATSFVANNVELHTIADEQGVKKMVKVDRLVVPAGGDLVMKSGGIHIMLMDLKKTLVIGDQFDIDIITQEVGTQKLSVTIVQM